MKQLVLPICLLLSLSAFAQEGKKAEAPKPSEKKYIITELELNGLTGYVGDNIVTKQGIPIVMLAEQIKQRGPIQDSVKQDIEKSKKK